MSIPNDALQKVCFLQESNPTSPKLHLTKCLQLLQEIEAQATISQRDSQTVRVQIATKQRDIRLNQLTIKEIESLPAGTNVYEGVGKMYALL